MEYRVPNTETTASIVITITAAVLIVAVLLVPVVSSVPGNGAYLHNEGDEEWAETDGSTHTIVISLEGNYYKVKTDGKVVRSIPVSDNPNIHDAQNRSAPVEYRVLSSNGNAISVLYGNGYFYGYIGNEAYPAERITAGNPLTLTVSATLDYTDADGISRSLPTDVYAGPGGFVESLQSEAYVLEDTMFYVADYTFFMSRDYTAGWAGHVGKGSIDNLPPTIDIVAAEPLTPVSMDYWLDYEEAVKDGTDCYQLLYITYDVYWGLEHGNSINASLKFIVPKDIPYENGSEGGAMSVLLGAIPVVVILGILMFTIYKLFPGRFGND